jgi:hypothetical protein
MLGENEIKSLIEVAAQTIFDEVAKGIEPLREATRAIQLDVIALRLATYQLAAVVASRYPDGSAMLRLWLESTIKLVDTVSLNDESSQGLPSEVETEVRSEIRKRLEVLAANVFEKMR